MKLSRFILFTLISIIFTDALKYLSWVAAINFENSTYIVSALNYISIFILIYISIRFIRQLNIPFSVKAYYFLWLFLNILSLIIGIFRAEDYWDWKFLFLSSISFSLISLTFFVGNDFHLTKVCFSFVLKYLFPFGFLIIPLALVTNEELYSRLMIPVSLFLLFIPYVKFKWKILIVIVALVSIFLVIGFRTNIFKVTFSIIFLLVYYFRSILKLGWIRLLQTSLFIIPCILLSLAIYGRYNLLSDIASNNFSYKNRVGKDENLLSDSRTFLYREVFLSLNKSGHWIFGEGAAGSYNSIWFYDTGGAINGKRFNTEIGMLNILLRNGIVGVIIYSLLMIIVSTVAITKSNNYLSKMLGLYIASLFLLSFIELYTQYDLNFYFFWIVIGLVSSNKFRAMSDLQIKRYFPL